MKLLNKFASMHFVKGKVVKVDRGGMEEEKGVIIIETLEKNR